MAFQSVPDCASAVVHFTQATQEVVNVLTFAYPGGYDQSAIDALAVAMDAAVGTYWLPLIHAGVNYDGVTVKGLENIIDLFDIETTNAGPGTSSGGTQPNNVTWAMRFVTGATGRSSRGRMYVVGLPSNQVDNSNDTITSGRATAWQTALVNTENDVAATGWIHVIVSRFTGGAQRPTGVYRVVTGVGWHDLGLDSQRGRLP